MLRVPLVQFAAGSFNQIGEGIMRVNSCRWRELKICVAASSLFLFSAVVHGQDASTAARSSSPASEREAGPEIRALADLIRDLQAQVQTLNSQLSELRTEEQRTSEEAHELRHELDLAKGRTLSTPNASLDSTPASVSQGYPPPSRPASPGAPASAQNQSVPDGSSRSDEDQQLIDGKLNDLYQTKVESGSKYRLRLSGLVLLNMFDNHGTVDNQDYPAVAEPAQTPPLFIVPSTFGGTLRQSQIELQAFGPDVAGARTSADVEFDFAGGFPFTPNGAAMGVVRLRTGTIRLDWANTSIVAGQDRLFFAPLAPTSLATLAVPALAYAGNLWAWTPQVRIEHRFVLSDTSSVSVQGGILDSLSGDYPVDSYTRYPTWGEMSGQPAYASRISLSHRVFGQNLTVGLGGYYARQNWGFGRIVNGWAGTTDVTLPLGKLFEFTGEFYRGRAVAGLGGGIGQSALFTGSFIDPATPIKGLDSMGGWAQLKFKARKNLEINGALGLDNPFASELRSFTSNPIYLNSFTRNLSPLVNFIYQVRSDILFSTEFRRLQTTILDFGSNKANLINFSVGYIF
jgi:hypothetical protein